MAVLPGDEIPGEGLPAQGPSVAGLPGGGPAGGGAPGGGAPGGDGLEVRPAAAGELAEIGRLRVAAYLAGGHLAPSSPYLSTLAALGTTGDGEILVAAGNGKILGTVVLQTWPHAAEIVTGPEEAEIRALAVAPDGQGRGVGTALLRALILRAGQLGIRHLVLSTQEDMRAAQRMYQRAGFRRLPDRDWSPVPGKILRVYGLRLPAG
ncbi:MAG: GNAT family N-acetyltransferase [Streptosporangiaceae bacterium]